MFNLFKKWRNKLYIWTYCKACALYFSEVANNALTEPQNDTEREIEEMLIDAMMRAGKELELSPASIALLSPYLRQHTAKELAKKFNNKDFVRKHMREGL